MPQLPRVLESVCNDIGLLLPQLREVLETWESFMLTDFKALVEKHPSKSLQEAPWGLRKFMAHDSWLWTPPVASKLKAFDLSRDWLTHIQSTSICLKRLSRFPAQVAEIFSLGLDSKMPMAKFTLNDVLYCGYGLAAPDQKKCSIRILAPKRITSQHAACWWWFLVLAYSIQHAAYSINHKLLINYGAIHWQYNASCTRHNTVAFKPQWHWPWLLTV